MKSISLYLAESGLVQPLIGDWRKMNAATREYVSVFGAVTVLTVLALIWAAYFRKRKRRRRLEHRAPNGWGKNPSEGDGKGAIATASRHGKRRRRREHRPRNPTLAETGGMPPTRAEGSSDTTA